MKRVRFSEEQSIGVLREAEAGAKAADLARKHCVSKATLYNLMSKYGGLARLWHDAPHHAPLAVRGQAATSLEDENGRLKRLLADAMLDNTNLR